ncbi:MAG: DUF1223 domain-containing protein [Albidovulum sp.]
MRQIWMAALGLWLGATGATLAQNQADSPVVVELYTSQGCSSCPPADEVLSKLAKRDDVIALGLHVDYWDYIGWKDAFADPAYSKRQRAYARVAGARTVYTPQMIVGGMDHMIGSRPAQVEKLIRRYTAKPATVALKLTRTGDRLLVNAQAIGNVPKGSLVQLVRYEPSSRVEIRRGENAGRSIDYANIVTSWKSVGEWDGGSDLSLDVKADGAAPLVIIIQEPGPGAILAAGRLR